MRQIQKERVKSMLKYKMVPYNLEYAKEIGVVWGRGSHSPERGEVFR